MAAFSRFIRVPRSVRDRRGGAALPRQPEASRRAAAYYEELGREPAGSIRKERARAPLRSSPCSRRYTLAIRMRQRNLQKITYCSKHSVVTGKRTKNISFT